MVFRAGAGLAAIVQAEIDLSGRATHQCETRTCTPSIRSEGPTRGVVIHRSELAKYSDPHRRGRKIREAFAIADEDKVLVALVIPRLSCGF
jgi:hypothetical protein